MFSRSIQLLPLLFLTTGLWAKSKQETEAAAKCKDCKTTLTLPTVSKEQLQIEECWRKHLVAAAKRKVESDFPGAPKGLCAGGVQSSLGEAGILPPKFPKPDKPFKGNLGYWHGDAIDFHDRGQSTRNQLNANDPYYPLETSFEPGKGFLHDLGFRNLIEEYPDDRQCLPGTVLVYAAGNEKRELAYQEKGTVRRPTGNYVGHVTVCGETKDAKGRVNVYYTDGKTEQPAIKGRRLVGVYTLSDCKHCEPAYKKICQKITRRQEYE